MARPLRIDQEDTFYHVLNRGNERRAVFRDVQDCEGFLSRLGRCSQRFSLAVYAYVLMGNHYHLLVRTREANLSAAIQWLGVSYSTWHNARHDRSGHLFQGRFKSFLITEDSYLHRLLLYIHRNPLRAGLVERLADYPWSSYRALAYSRGGPAWFDRRLVYEQVFARRSGSTTNDRMTCCRLCATGWCWEALRLLRGCADVLKENKTQRSRS